jgi:DNA replication protein DnaC
MSRSKRDLTSLDMVRAGVPERYWTSRLSEIPERAAYRKPVGNYLADIETFIDNGDGLYLWSDQNGTGKSALASVILRRALAVGYSGYYIRSQALKDAIATSRVFDESETINERVRRVDLLVIDDLAKEYRTESGFTQLVLEDVIRERVQRKKSTVLTANLPAKSISEMFTSDLADVLREAVGIVEVGGPEMGGKLWRAEIGTELRKRLHQ